MIAIPTLTPLTTWSLKGRTLTVTVDISDSDLAALKTYLEAGGEVPPESVIHLVMPMDLDNFFRTVVVKTSR